MGDTVGQFDFELTGMDITVGDSAIPMPTPIVHICLKHWGATTQYGSPHVSDDLMSDGEIDEWIDALKTDLEKVRREAKRAMLKATAKVEEFKRGKRAE